ncbi:MAG: metallophosphoesterase [Chloroflexi bacterium]|nr:metallophosphoesterase [Chloroflexota bacterium]
MAKIRVAAVGCIHVHEQTAGHFATLMEKVNDEADILLLAGDLTISGSMDEALALVKELTLVKIPTVAVLGNHDHESSLSEEVAELLRSNHIPVLDGTCLTYEIDGKKVGIAGTKGFAGGFEGHVVAPFGEKALKDFVHAGQRECQKIEEALTDLERVDYKVVLLHYSPVRDTVVGEPAEIYPFLGNSHLAVPIDRLGAAVIFHAHAHYGTHAGRTPGGIPVFNVARTLVHNYMVYELE